MGELLAHEVPFRHPGRPPFVLRVKGASAAPADSRDVAPRRGSAAGTIGRSPLSSERTRRRSASSPAQASSRKAARWDSSRSSTARYSSSALSPASDFVTGRRPEGALSRPSRKDRLEVRGESAFRGSWRGIPLASSRQPGVYTDSRPVPLDPLVDPTARDLGSLAATNTAGSVRDATPSGGRADSTIWSSRDGIPSPAEAHNLSALGDFGRSARRGPGWPGCCPSSAQARSDRSAARARRSSGKEVALKIRRAVSLTALGSFLFLSWTGIMLFLSPQGRVAYWSGWTLGGLSKEQYGSLHTTFMVLFLLVGVWHIVLNWRPIVGYLKDRTTKVRVATPEFSLAIALCGAFFVGTLAGVFPFQQFLAVGDVVKDYWERSSGSPPWGHAELSSLDRFCRGMEDFERLENQRLVAIDCDEAVAALRDAGIEVEGRSQQLIEIARINSTHLRRWQRSSSGWRNRGVARRMRPLGARLPRHSRCRTPAWGA